MPTGVYKRTAKHKKTWFKKGNSYGFQKGHQINKGLKRSKQFIENLSNSRQGKDNQNWKGGKTKSMGYIYIYKPSHPRAHYGRYVKRSHLVIEKYLGRYLLPKERCHHQNGIKDDDRPENLMAFTSESAHQRFHHNPNNVKPSEIIFDGRKLNRLLELEVK